MEHFHLMDLMIGQIPSIPVLTVLVAVLRKEAVVVALATEVPIMVHCLDPTKNHIHHHQKRAVEAVAVITVHSHLLPQSPEAIYWVII